MSSFARFDYEGLESLLSDAARLRVELPVSDDLSVLAQPVRVGRRVAPNRLAVHPMEGCDGLADGSPGPLTVRRYERFAAGGAGLLWFEACAIVPDGRANPRQIWLHRGTLAAFAEMVRRARQAARQATGQSPMLVLQLTHSGRYSRPGAKPAPIIAHRSAVLDPRHNLPADYPLISDEELDRLQDAYVEAAKLAAEAGFDAVDIKSCHRYLISELLAGFTRADSRYGGDGPDGFDNRTRMLRETFERVRQAVGDRLEVLCRLNVYDAVEFPYGWGVARDRLAPDPAEPIKLIGLLARAGMPAVNVTVANPYFNPHVNRPADWAVANWPAFPEHPLTGVGRIVELTRQVQQAHPDLAIVGTGYSWLRHFLPPVAAGLVKQGWVTLIGLGRGAFAYPDFARDILRAGRMDRLKVCVTCSGCTQIMRDGGKSGCVVRDSEVYEPIYKTGRLRDRQVLRDLAGQCRRCADANCAAHCPAGIDVPAFLSAVAEGQFRQAYDNLRRHNLLAGVCGAVCPVEVQCEGHCIRRHLADGPVPIAAIQRWVSRLAVEQGDAALRLSAEPTGRSVAIVGAGPAGLSAAARLLERGHRVNILERTDRAGGKLVSVIPTERLPRDEAAEELSAVFRSVDGDRLRWRFNTALGAGCDLKSLFDEGFDAVLLAMGLGETTGLSGPPGRPDGVVDANAFLAEFNGDPGRRLAGRVAVIGGGNTAVDAAVMAARRGARDVYLIYRRSYGQMPAWPRERDEALHEGVHLMPFVQPVAFVLDSAGRATGLRLRRTELGEPGADGRRRPVEQPDSEFAMDFELIVEAMGERPAAAVLDVLGAVGTSPGGLVRVDERFMTAQPGVFAAGDLVNGGATVVQAVAEGRQAADAVDAFLSSRRKTPRG